MSKLLDLKEWITTEEAANYLSKELGEDITEADIFKLALQDELILSVYFVTRRTFQKGYIEKLDFEKHFYFLDHLSSEGNKVVTLNLNVLDLPNREEVIVFDGNMDEPVRVKGCFDIINAYSGRSEISYNYHLLESGVELELFNLEGLIVKEPKSNICYRLVEAFDSTSINTSYYPIEELGEYSLIVVRVEVLKDFVKKINNQNEEVESELSTKEKETLYKIIRMLLLETDLLQHASINKNSEIKGHNTIAKILINNIGDKVKNLPSQRTIANVLKETMLDLKPEDFNKE